MHISYRQALGIIEDVAKQANSSPRTPVSVKLSDALSRISHEDVLSPVSTPGYDSSAMDGYAVDSAVTSTASLVHPVKLLVIGSIAAGDTPPRSSRTLIQNILGTNHEYQGVCWEIMTGAPFPDVEDVDFDSVIKVEDVDRQGQIVVISRPVPKLSHHRYAGADIRKGGLLLQAGTKILPSHIMRLASVGISIVMVASIIKIVVISTGSELQSHYSGSLKHKQMIYDSNGPYITSFLSLVPNVTVEYHGICSDDSGQFQSLLMDYKDYNIMITTGAVSAGKHDFIVSTLREEKINAEILFHHVAIRPGHPVLFARLRSGCTFFGLPGNPLAAVACTHFLVVPYISLLQAQRNIAAPEYQACTHMDLNVSLYTPTLTHFLLAKKENGNIWVPLKKDRQRSSLVSSLAEADGWIMVHADDQTTKVVDFSMYAHL